MYLTLPLALPDARDELRLDPAFFFCFLAAGSSSYSSSSSSSSASTNFLFEAGVFEGEILPRGVLAALAALALATLAFGLGLLAA